MGIIMQAWGNNTKKKTWKNVLDWKLIPRLSPDFPLTVAICGGGSSGKSTLFNSIAGDWLSPSGGSAGINRRILVSVPGTIFRQKQFLSILFQLSKKQNQLLFASSFSFL